MEKSSVTAVCWVPRGVCQTREDDGEEEEEEEEGEHKGAPSSSSRGPGGTSKSDEFDMEHYDDEEDGGLQFFTVLQADQELLKQPDPYMKKVKADSDDEESDDAPIGPEDHVFMAVSCEEDSCLLEVYTYDDENADMYVHHDIMLPSYPLCVEWLRVSAARGEGNYAAIGSIDHTLMIWDLNELHPLEPCQTLGEAKKPKVKGKKKRPQPPGSGRAGTAHAGPVLCLHGSPFSRNLLASGSADETVKVWDVTEGNCLHSYNNHGNKVQCVRWHPTEASVMLSAGFDRRLALMDVRQPGQAAMVDLPGEAECAIWDRHSPFQCMASSDNGYVQCYDVRQVASNAPNSTLWTLAAHDVACTAVHDFPTKGILITASLDGHAKVWNIGTGQPSMVFAKNLQAGPLFSCQSNPEYPALACFGGKCPVMWDLTSESVIVRVFDLPTDPDAAED